MRGGVDDDQWLVQDDLKFPATQPTMDEAVSDPTVSGRDRWRRWQDEAPALGVPDRRMVCVPCAGCTSFCDTSTPCSPHGGRSPLGGLRRVEPVFRGNTEQIDLLDSLGRDKTGWARTGETMKGD